MIDNKKTKEKVEKLLKNYYRYRRLAGLPTETIDDSVILDFPTMDGSKKDLSINLQRKLEAQIAVKEIHRVLSVLNEQSLERIQQRFMSNRNVTDILEEEMISGGTFYRQLNKGMLEFAEAYKVGELLVITAERVGNYGI